MKSVPKFHSQLFCPVSFEVPKITLLLSGSRSFSLSPLAQNSKASRKGEDQENLK